jgi:chaperone required for assembly of F1-ATPase
MRNLLEEFAAGDGPMQRAQKGMRPVLPRRFYKRASAVARDGAFHLELDGKPARTPARNLLAVPNATLGAALAAEWNAVGETIDPATMPLTRLLNVALDRVAANADTVAADIANYAGSDLVCYRAAEPEELVIAQDAAWEPVLSWAFETLGARFVHSEGIRHVAQPEGSLAAVRAGIDKIERPLGLAALATVTALTGSVLVAVMLAQGALTPDRAWDAGHVDEDWNIRKWREDAEAMQRRAARRAEFDAAAQVLAALRPAP